MSSTNNTASSQASAPRNSTKRPQGIRQRIAQVWARPLGKVALGLAAALLVALVAGVSAAAIYVFGASGGTHNSSPPTTATLVATNGGTIFTLDPSGTQATFTMSEVLLGRPNTVVGKTNSVSGQIEVNTQQPALSQVGQIKVDLTTLATDSDLRNNTIQGRILETGDPSNQYAVFDPTGITGLPASITVGQPVSFQLNGNLTIHQVTKAETFDVQATLRSATQLTGTAQTTVRYEDFNLAIPDVPSVTNVSDNVQLALTFAANA